MGRKLRRDAFSFEGWYCVSVTVADYANSDPAVVRSGRVKKAVANAVQQEGRLPASLFRLRQSEKKTRFFIFLGFCLSVFLTILWGSSCKRVCCPPLLLTYSEEGKD